MKIINSKLLKSLARHHTVLLFINLLLSLAFIWLKTAIPFSVTVLIVAVLAITAISQTLSNFYEYMETVKAGDGFSHFYNNHYHYGFDIGAYAFLLVVVYLGFNLDISFGIFVGVPLIIATQGINMALFTYIRIYLVSHGHVLNKSVTGVFASLSVVLLLPACIPVFYALGLLG